MPCLQGEEKSVVARHEVGHALVSTAVAALLPSTQGLVDKLSIIPRSGGALGFTYIPPLTEDRWVKSGNIAQPRGGMDAGPGNSTQPNTEIVGACRALMFDREIRGQLAMLMGGRAAEELTCEAGGRASGWVAGWP